MCGCVCDGLWVWGFEISSKFLKQQGPGSIYVETSGRDLINLLLCSHPQVATPHWVHSRFETCLPPGALCTVSLTLELWQAILTSLKAVTLMAWLGYTHRYSWLCKHSRAHMQMNAHDATDLAHPPHPPHTHTRTAITARTHIGIRAPIQL